MSLSFHFNTPTLTSIQTYIFAYVHTYDWYRVICSLAWLAWGVSLQSQRKFKISTAWNLFASTFSYSVLVRRARAHAYICTCVCWYISHCIYCAEWDSFAFIIFLLLTVFFLVSSYYMHYVLSILHTFQWEIINISLRHFYGISRCELSCNDFSLGWTKIEKNGKRTELNTYSLFSFIFLYYRKCSLFVVVAHC